VIVKDKDTILNATKNEAKGEAAEKQMAFYLNRQFGDARDVFVFNDLRIERNGEFAQMDHLIVHQFGLIIVESKSVTGSITVNEHLEFERKTTGIPSPILQARRQGDLLRALLTDHKKELRGKVLGLIQEGFKTCPINIFVAISDTGKIRRVGRKIKIPELMKADQVSGAVQELITAHKKGGSIPFGELLLESMDAMEGKKKKKKHEAKEDLGNYKFKTKELTKVVEFLKASHKPSTKAEVSQISDPVVKKKLPTYICTHCHETNLSIEYDNSYYFKCHSCDGNTPIKNRCAKCNEVTRTRKSKLEFTSVCKSCDVEELFFLNP